MSRTPSLSFAQQDMLADALCAYIGGDPERKRYLAESVVVRESTVDSWIDRKRTPTKDRIPKICRVIGSTVGEVFGTTNVGFVHPDRPNKRPQRPRGTQLWLDERQEQILADAILAHMKRHTLNQTELAERLGVQQSYIYRWTRCIGRPTKEQLQAICRELGTPLSKLFPYGHTWAQLTNSEPTPRTPFVKAERATNARGQAVLRLDVRLDIPADSRAIELLTLLREAREDPLNK